MRSKEFIVELTADDAAMRRRGWKGDEEFRDWFNKWTAIDAIKDILGNDKVTTDDDDDRTGVYYVYDSDRAFFIPISQEEGGGGSISLLDIYSSEVADVVQGVHEAYHAYMHTKVPTGSIYSNEKFVNKLAAKWLRAHLSGIELHTALEALLKSKISYGHNESMSK